MAKLIGIVLMVTGSYYIYANYHTRIENNRYVQMAERTILKVLPQK